MIKQILHKYVVWDEPMNGYHTHIHVRLLREAWFSISRPPPAQLEENLQPTSSQSFTLCDILTPPPQPFHKRLKGAKHAHLYLQTLSYSFIRGTIAAGSVYDLNVCKSADRKCLGDFCCFVFFWVFFVSCSICCFRRGFGPFPELD